MSRSSLAHQMKMNPGFGPTGYYSKTLQAQMAEEEDDDDDPTILGSRYSIHYTSNVSESVPEPS